MVFFVNDTATTEIYTLSPTRRSSDLGDDLHLLDDPVVQQGWLERTAEACGEVCGGPSEVLAVGQDRKSTRLNSSHANISYAVFCLNKDSDIIWVTFTQTSS